MLRENRRVKKGSSNTRHENKTFTAKMTTGFIWTGETGYTKKENYTNMFLLRSLKPPIKCWEKIPSSLFNPHTAHALNSWCLQICVSRQVHSRARGLIPPVRSTNTPGMSPSLIHYLSPILNTGLIMAPPSLLPSAFNGPHTSCLRNTSGPSPHFQHCLRGAAFTYHRELYVAFFKGAIIYLQLFLAIVHNAVKIVFWKKSTVIIKIPSENPSISLWFFRIISKILLWFISSFSRIVLHTRRPSMYEEKSQVQSWVICLKFYNPNLYRTSFQYIHKFYILFKD